jgi:hypothetical protein
MTIPTSTYWGSSTPISERTEEEQMNPQHTLKQGTLES